MPSSTIDPKIIPKLKHNVGREYYGYLLPREIVAVSEAGAILTVSRRQDVVKARERMRAGENRPWPFYFEIHSGGTLAKALAKRMPKEHSKG